jgi:hypothetical protein
MHWHVVDVELDGHFFKRFFTFKPYWSLMAATNRREVIIPGKLKSVITLIAS